MLKFRRLVFSFAKLTLRNNTTLPINVTTALSNSRYLFSSSQTPNEKDLDAVKQKGQQFLKKHVQDIIELQKIQDWTEIVSSTTEPMLIDFYADWCQPCKKLTPRLEERVKKAGGKIKLLKINIDKFGQIANVFKVKAVPTVFLIYGGKSVDAFSGDLNDQGLDKFIQTAFRVSKFDHLQEEVMKNLEEGQAAIRSAEYEKAQKILINTKISMVKQEYGFVRNIFLAFVYGQLGKTSLLKALVETMKPNQSFYIQKPEFKDLYENLIGLCEEVQKAKSQNSEIGEWRSKLQAQPKNLQLKYEAAEYYKQNQLAEEALQQLLSIVKLDKNWQQKKANKLMLAIFKQLGNVSPLTQNYRKLLQRALN